MKPIQSFVIASAVKMIQKELAKNNPVLITQKSSFEDAYKALKPEQRFGEVYFLRVDGYEPGTTSDSTLLSGAIRPYALARAGLTAKVLFRHSETYPNYPANSESAINKQGSTSIPIQEETPQSDSSIIPYIAKNISIMPVIYRCTLLFSTPDSSEQADFFARWMFASIKTRLGFMLAYEDLNLWCDCILGQDLMAVGDRPDLSAGQTRSLMYEGQINIGGWFMNPNDLRDNKEVNLIRTININ